MSSRDQILGTVKKNQPNEVPLPPLDFKTNGTANVVEIFTAVLTKIGGLVLEVNSLDEIRQHIDKNYKGTDRILSLVPGLDHEKNNFLDAPHLLETVTLAILTAQLGVAESGAVWITDLVMGDRALPFITEHLAIILYKKNIVHTLHQAYETIGLDDYNLGIFIAGPSKTADIEQSLVLGAHGAKSLVVFLM